MSNENEDKKAERHERASREYADAVKALREQERQLAHHAWWERELREKTVPAARQLLTERADELRRAIVDITGLTDAPTLAALDRALASGLTVEIGRAQ